MCPKLKDTTQYTGFVSTSQSSGSTSVIALIDVGLFSFGNEQRLRNARSKLIGRDSSIVADLTIEFDVSELSSCDSEPTISPAAELDADRSCSETVPCVDDLK